MSRFAPVSIATKSGPVDVFGEVTDNPYLFITPVLDEHDRLAEGWTLTHGPTGYRLPGQIMSSPSELRILASKVAQLDWSSADPADLSDKAAAYRHALGEHEATITASPFETPSTFPDGTGTPRQALPLLAYMLDVWQHTWSAHEDTPFHLAEGVFNPDWQRQVDHLLDIYGMAYLLAALHVHLPEIADQVTATLADMWRDGDDLAEWAQAWRRQLAAGEALTLPGVRTPDVVGFLRHGAEQVTAGVR